MFYNTDLSRTNVSPAVNLVIFLFSAIFNLSDSLPSDLGPIRVFEMDHRSVSDLPRLYAEDYYTDIAILPPYFKVIHRDIEHGVLYVGARDYVFELGLNDISDEGIIHEYFWKSPSNDVSNCRRRNLPRSIDSCYNYIQMIEVNSQGHMYICGTSALSPKCREFSHIGHSPFTHTQSIRNISSTALIPLYPDANSTAVFHGKFLYTANQPSMGSMTLIYKSQGDSDEDLSTPSYNEKMFSMSSQFIFSFTHEDKIYFMFREPASELADSSSRAVYSRIGKVCGSDTGGLNILDEHFTSFQKARLNCSIGGDYPFYFDEIQGATFVEDKNDPMASTIYAVFNTPINSIPGSAVCAFTLGSVWESYTGYYWPNTPLPDDLFTTQTDDIDITSGKCVNDTKLLSDDYLTFIQNHALMAKGVASTNDGIPLYLTTRSSDRLSTIVVDDTSFSDYTVIFVGSVMGYVSKIIHVKSTSEVIMVETVHVGEDPIITMENNGNNVIIVSSHSVFNLPKYRCDNYENQCACLKSRDPYCGWDSWSSSCRDFTDKSFHRFLQEVDYPNSNDCDDLIYTDKQTGENELENSKMTVILALLCLGIGLAVGALLMWVISKYKNQRKNQKQKSVELRSDNRNGDDMGTHPVTPGGTYLKNSPILPLKRLPDLQQECVTRHNPNPSPPLSPRPPVPPKPATLPKHVLNNQYDFTHA